MISDSCESKTCSSDNFTLTATRGDANSSFNPDVSQVWDNCNTFLDSIPNFDLLGTQENHCLCVITHAVNASLDAPNLRKRQKMLEVGYIFIFLSILSDQDVNTRLCQIN